MQKITIRPIAVALLYARFLSAKHKSVKYVACFENKAILEVDMRPCKTPAQHEAEKENDADR